YQMLGRTVADPDGLEGPPGEASGLGLLAVDTVLTPEKVLRPVRGRFGQAAFEGYEIHCGRTTVSDRPMLTFDDGGVDGAMSADGRIAGCYVHGLFDRPQARSAILSGLGAASSGVDQRQAVDSALEDIAAALERAFDIAALGRIAGLGALKT
ncbi:MAG TPA: cobyric acid synthase CobQ, partial [Caulobacter sp.]|nr:cobyric acid synthase CobQ [Caulobacter sp.]